VTDPTQASRPPEAPVAFGAENSPDAGAETARPSGATEPTPDEVAERAAADVTLLLSRAVGLRRAVELAERSRREPGEPVEQ
jgi:hypothetical protein